MINGKFCSCKMPLDLEDSNVALEGEALARALNDVDREGWNPNSVVGRTSWLRVRGTTAKFREEILELSLGASIDNLEDRARYYHSQSLKSVTHMHNRTVKERLRESEKALPSKLRDWPARWVLERTVAENYFQLSKHLEFVYSEFLLDRTLVKRLRVSSAELVVVSRSLLSSMLIMTGNRHRQGWYSSDLPWLVYANARIPVSSEGLCL